MEFKTIKTFFECNVLSNRIFIITSKQGLEDFQDYIGYLDPGYEIFSDLVCSSNIDYIISINKTNFFTLVKLALLAIDRDTKFIKVPKLFADIVRPNSTYYVSPAKVGVNNMKVKLFMDKYCNTEEYSILDKDELLNMDDDVFMLHQNVELKIQTNRILTEYLSKQFEGFSFSWHLMEDTFIQPTDVKYFQDTYELWEQSCKSALEAYHRVGKSERTARILLPASCAYDLTISINLMQLYKFCKALIKTDEYMFQYDDTLVLAKGLQDTLKSFNYIEMINELLPDMEKIINQYDLPF